MSPNSQAERLWEPSLRDLEGSNLTQYMRWLEDHLNLQFLDYWSLWQWSVENKAEFWMSLWSYFDIRASSQPYQTLLNDKMPGAKWFPGAVLNYAENFFARENSEHPAILFAQESKSLREISWHELRQKTNRLAAYLRDIDVKPGDRVAAFLPNIPEAVIALLAVTSLGAIWSSCSPDFGSRSVLDRFQQIEPKVLLVVDGYQYNGRWFDRTKTLKELQDGLPTLEKTIIYRPEDRSGSDLNLVDAVDWNEIVSTHSSSAKMHFEQVPFDHPLWVLYSSGTTGLPKPIVQSHGGILLEHLKMSVLHLDLSSGDRFFWYTSTGWMMWNFLIGGLLAGSTIVIYDGSPSYPDMSVLWELAQKCGTTYFGTSAAYIHACLKAEDDPSGKYDLSHIRAIGSTGSPLSAEGFRWVYEHINPHLALESVSGGTDLCTAFLCGSRILPIYAGEIQAPALGAKVQAFNEQGDPIIGEVGELVIVEPMPSMPLFFWNDPENQRYIDSYFKMFPGVWRHGDWIKFTSRGSCIIYGRSDSTINRQGVRMGTSEIYRALETLPEVQDSLVIDLEFLERESYMLLFVVLTPGTELDEELKKRIKETVRNNVSPRHTPDDIFEVPDIPYTLSGKKMELPVRRILLGQSPNEAANPGAMRNPHAIDYFVNLAKTFNQTRN